MTTPVMPGAPAAARAAAAADAGGSDSAAPFASALDGALSAGRAPVDDAGAETGGQQPGSDAEVPAEAVVEPVAAPAGVVAALWALAAAGAPATGEAVDGEAFPRGTPVAVGKNHVAGTAPGLAVAAARAGGAAHGLPVTGRADAGVPAAAVPPAPAPAVPAGSTTTAVPGLPEGVTVVSVTGSGPAPSEGTVPPAVTGPAVPGSAVPAPGTDPSATPLVPATAVAAPTGAAGDGASAPSTTGPATAGPVAAPVAAGAGTATGGGAGRNGDRGAETPAAGPVENLGATGGTNTAVASPVPATGEGDAATGTAASTAVGSQIARQVAVLRGGPDGAHSMTLVLTPETLGTVEVSVTVSQGTVELTLRGAHEHGRAALLDALPDLRRDLESAGLTCSRLDVDRNTREGAGSAAQQFGDRAPGERGAQHERSETGSRSWLRSADNGEGRPVSAGSRSTSPGVDVRV